MKGQFEAWNRQRTDFNNRLASGDPDAAKEAWQRFYFKGEIPEALGSAPETHANKRRLKNSAGGLTCLLPVAAWRWGGGPRRGGGVLSRAHAARR